MKVVYYHKDNNNSVYYRLNKNKVTLYVKLDLKKKEKEFFDRHMCIITLDVLL